MMWILYFENIKHFKGLGWRENYCTVYEIRMQVRQFSISTSNDPKLKWPKHLQTVP